jgi:hypothetical protein
MASVFNPSPSHGHDPWSVLTSPVAFEDSNNNVVDNHRYANSSARSNSPFGSSSSVFGPPVHGIDQVVRDSPSAFFNVGGGGNASRGMMYNGGFANNNANPDMGLFDMSAFTDFPKMDAAMPMNGIGGGSGFAGRRLTQDSPSPTSNMSSSIGAPGGVNTGGLLPRIPIIRGRLDESTQHARSTHIPI